MDSSPTGADNRSQFPRARGSGSPTFNAYCATGTSASLVQAALRRGLAGHVWQSWADVEAYGRDMALLIAIIPRLTQTEFEQISHFRSSFGSRPLVVVTEKDAETARMLGRLNHVEIVWTGEVESNLAGVVQRLEDASILGRLAKNVAGAESLGPSLRDGLVTAILQDRAVRSVDELGKLAARSRSTVERDWNRAMLGREGLRLKDLLDWILLLRAAQLQESGDDWSEAAAALGIHVRTLGRVAQRLTRKKLDHIALAGFPALAAMCFDEIRPRLAPSGQWLISACRTRSRVSD